MDLWSGVDSKVLLVLVMPEWPGWDSFNRELRWGGIPEISNWYIINCNKILPIDNKISPQVAHYSCNFPIFIAEIEDSSGEKIDKLIAMGHSTRNWRLFTREEEVPQGSVAIMLK